jgi:glyoxylase I family protein
MARERSIIMADFIPPPHNSASPFADMRGHHVAVRERVTPDPPVEMVGMASVPNTS